MTRYWMWFFFHSFLDPTLLAAETRPMCLVVEIPFFSFLSEFVSSMLRITI